MRDAIRRILGQHARLPDVERLADDADLYAAGLTSHATVNVMVALEDHFGIEFPDRLLRRRSFESIEAISATIQEVSATIQEVSATIQEVSATIQEVSGS